MRAGPGLEEEMLARAVSRRVGRVSIPFVETNDLVVLKMLAGREKDLEDVRTLLRAGTPELYVDVVRDRLTALGQLIDDSSLVAAFDAQVVTARRRKRGRS